MIGILRGFIRTAIGPYIEEQKTELRAYLMAELSAIYAAIVATSKDKVVDVKSLIQGRISERWEERLQSNPELAILLPVGKAMLLRQIEGTALGEYAAKGGTVLELIGNLDQKDTAEVQEAITRAALPVLEKVAARLNVNEG